MTSRIAAISIAAVNPRRVAEFWCAALGWEILLLDSTGADIGPPNGSGPIIEFGRVSEKKTVKNRLHFDLRADGSTQGNELRRLLDLGAQKDRCGPNIRRHVGCARRSQKGMNSACCPVPFRRSRQTPEGSTDSRHLSPIARMGCKPRHFEDSYVTFWVRVPVLGIRSAEAFGCLYSKGIAGHRRVAV